MDNLGKYDLPTNQTTSQKRMTLPTIATDQKRISECILFVETGLEAMKLEVKAMLLALAKTFDNNLLPPWTEHKPVMADLILGVALDGVLGNYLKVVSDHAASTDATMRQHEVGFDDDDIQMLMAYMEEFDDVFKVMDTYTSMRLKNMRNALAMAFVYCVAGTPRSDNSTKWLASREQLIKSHYASVMGTGSAPGCFTLRGVAESSQIISARKMFLPKCYSIALLLGVAEVSDRSDMDLMAPLRDIANYLANASKSAIVICAEYLKKGNDPMMFTSHFDGERATVEDYVKAITVNPSYKFAYLYNASILEHPAVKVRRLLSYIIGYVSESDETNTILSYALNKDEKMMEIGRISATEFMMLRDPKKPASERVALAEQLYMVAELMLTKGLVFSEAVDAYKELSDFHL